MMNPCIASTMAWKSNTKRLLGINAKLCYVVLSFAISVSLIDTSYAQTQSDLSEQTTLSNNLLNDPLAQDILKKIEQTKKMIEELQQKEYEKNQAQESLEKMRTMSLERLNQDLAEWERLWEQQSARNSFEKFVSKKPSYVQGVFLDQFEFMEQKVNAGRKAMHLVLASGGGLHEAKTAYNKAASTQRIELIEMNAQFNIKHNLASYKEQQLFNSTGQIHFSPVTELKLAELYTDYKLQPSYILANSDDRSILGADSQSYSEIKCGNGSVLTSHLTTGTHACIDEATAKKWVDAGIKGISIRDVQSTKSSVLPTNPGTTCDEGSQVIYHIATSEYMCVLESTAKEMIGNGIGEIHTLEVYILGKDKKKTVDDLIYGINQEIQRIHAEYEGKKKTLGNQYDVMIDQEISLAKQKTQEAVGEYKIGNVTKEDITRIILDVNAALDLNNERLIKEKSDAISKLEQEMKNKIQHAVKGYESNPDIILDRVI